MKTQRRVFALLTVSLLCFSYCAEAKDLYKILGVDKNASQREVQKAFHRLSLKYHPDKNPSKSAQAKFAEINNAYEVLSDEEKRKNYDQFGDDEGRARGPEQHAYGGNFYRTNGGGSQGGSHGQDNFFRFPTENIYGGQGRSFSFSFGGQGSPYENIFSSFFGSMGGDQGEGQHFGQHFTNFGTEGRANFKRSNVESGSHSTGLIEELTLESFQRHVLDGKATWAVLFASHRSNEAQERLQLLEETSMALKGTIKVGYVDCRKQEKLCKQQQLDPLKAMRLRFYSLRSNGKLIPLDYTGEWSMNDVKKYGVDVLPKFSKHLDDVNLLVEAVGEENRAVAVLLTKKRDTPAIWRALSGLFYGRLTFFDVQVNDDEAERIARRFQVDSFPAILGIDGNGKAKVLSSGTKHTSYSLDQYKALLEEFEKSSKAAGPKKAKTTMDSDVASLTKKNFNRVCGQDTPLCVIGIHKSSSESDKLRKILKEISQKSLIRKGRMESSLRSPVSYGVVDATKQSAFLNSFEKGLAGSKNAVLIAYKPKKGTYTVYNGPLNLEKAETFVTEVLGGDLQLQRVRQEPVLV